MAKDKYVAGAGVAVAEEPDKDAESTPTPEPTPAPAPETPATTEAEPAPAAALDNRVTVNTIPMLAWESSEARRVLQLFETAENLSRSLRSALHFFIGAENARGKMTTGQQLYFTAIANGTLDCEAMAVQAQEAMTGQITLDNEGEVVISSKG